MINQKDAKFIRLVTTPRISPPLKTNTKNTNHTQYNEFINYTPISAVENSLPQKISKGRKPTKKFYIGDPEDTVKSVSLSLHHCPFQYCPVEYRGSYNYEAITSHFRQDHYQEIFIRQGKEAAGSGYCPFYSCAVKNGKVKLFKSFKSHMDLHYPRKDALKFACNICGKLFLRMTDKQRHESRMICSGVPKPDC